jgi:hypothetical protein
METTKGISLYSYLYLKLKKAILFFIIYDFSSTKLENKRGEQVLPQGWGGGKGGSGPNNVYICK